MTYLAVFEGNGSRVNRESLVKSLRVEWPDAEVLVSDGSQPDRETRDVSWSLRRGDGEVEGRSHVDGTCIYLDGSYALTVEFVVWYRKLVPEQEELIFCDESYSFAIPVPVGATVSDVESSAE